MEYSVISIFVLIIAIFLNLKLNSKFPNWKISLPSILVISFAQLIMDNLTVWRGFWFFNDSKIFGLKIPFMPIENLFFGISLFLFTILFWEISLKLKKSS